MKQHEADGVNGRGGRRVPLWMWAVLVACLLPGAIVPFMLSQIPYPTPIFKGLVWFYPVYVLVSVFLAWQCYGRRTVMSWIILVLLAMSHWCFYYMTFADVSKAFM